MEAPLRSSKLDELKSLRSIPRGGSSPPIKRVKLQNFTPDSKPNVHQKNVIVLIFGVKYLTHWLLVAVWREYIPSVRKVTKKEGVQSSLEVTHRALHLFSTHPIAHERKLSRRISI